MAKRKTDDSSLDQLHHYGLYIPTRTVTIGNGASDGEIDYSSAMQAMKNIHVLHQLSQTEPINIIMNTPGGSVDQGLAIYDLLSVISNPVAIFVYGRCYSMGAILLQAADRRVMLPNSALMIHRGSVAYEGDATAVDRWYRFEKHVDKTADAILLTSIREKHPAFTPARLRRLLATDTILVPAEAVAIGLADDILPVQGDSADE